MTDDLHALPATALGAAFGSGRLDPVAVLESVLARAALWLLGADRYGEKFWQQLREQIADAPLRASEVPAAGNVVPSSSSLSQAAPAATPETQRPRGWLAPHAGWLR